MPKFRSVLALLIGFVATAVIGTGTALAQVPPPDPAGSTATSISTDHAGQTVTAGHAGSPIWVFVVVAAITMLVTAAITYVAAGRRRQLSGQLT